MLDFDFRTKGTGKTTTLTELMLQIITNVKNSKIIVATQSNSAANLIAQHLVSSNQVDTLAASEWGN